jgi:hypothetical protein
LLFPKPREAERAVPLTAGWARGEVLRRFKDYIRDSPWFSVAPGSKRPTIAQAYASTSTVLNNELHAGLLEGTPDGQIIRRG